MKLASVLVACFLAISISTTANAACSEGQIQFTFEKMQVKIAFKLLADFGQVKAKIDPAINYIAPIKFPCTPWQDAAAALAEKYKLTLKIEDGIMHVTKQA